MVRYNIASNTWDAPQPLPRMGGVPNSGDRYWTTEPEPDEDGAAASCCFAHRMEQSALYKQWKDPKHAS